MKTKPSISRAACPKMTAGGSRTACPTNLLPLLLLLTLPAVVQAQFTYETNNGTITITGYTGPGGDVTIPDRINGLPVTSIGDTAFYWCTGPTNITIPNSVTNIGNGAFGGQTSPTLAAITVDALNPAYGSVDGVLFNKAQTTLIQFPLGKAGSYTIPNSVTNIADWAFSQCNSLTNVTIPNSVIGLGNGVFSSCTSLTAITVDTNDSVYSSVDGILFDKTQTTIIQYPAGKAGSYTVPTSVTSIGDEAFYNCESLTSVTIPNTVSSIGQWAFYTCSGLSSITIPNGVTSIGNAAFWDCSSLTSVTIPNSVISIGDDAFCICGSLSSITIPNGITSIGDFTFAYCPNLTDVHFWGNAPTFGWSVFVADSNATVYYLPGTTGWGTNFAGLPTALWGLPNPLILNNGSSFGVQSNQFGFIISWATNVPVVVEACTDLANSLWSPVATNTLSGGSSYFSDADLTNYPARFYRLRSP